jgi:predicted RND superfamily exporter protein
MSKVCHAGAIPALIIALVLAIPAYLESGAVSFTYGEGSNLAPDTQVNLDSNTINSSLGESQTWAIMVPEGHWAEEQELVDELKALPTTKSVLFWSTIASNALPTGLGDESQVSQLLSGGYSRIVLTSKIPDESEEGFQLVNTVRSLLSEHYGSDTHLVGNNVSYYDIRSVTSQDSMTVRFASIAAIGLVLLFMFKSISIPILLILAIELSIWINEAVPYFMGDTINFVAFLVIDAVQLGADVDYAIIYTEDYLAHRKTQTKLTASVDSVERTAQSIMTSSSILILACLGIYFAVSSPMIQQVGMLIARGSLISVIEIFFVLPLLFRIFDGFVRHTTRHAGFYLGKHDPEPQGTAPEDGPTQILPQGSAAPSSKSL